MQTVEKVILSTNEIPVVGYPDRYTSVKQEWAKGSAHMPPKPTWKPHTEHGDLSSKEREELPESVFAFPKQRKEPLTDAAHVKNALARFDQVEDVSDLDRDLAFANIQAAARHFDLNVEESDWRQLGKRPHTKNAAHE
jgi:hypothetical protein